MIIRTVSGDLSPTELGRINYHEHAFQVSQLLIGDELQDLEKSAAEFTHLADSGFDSYVEATPIGLGRRTDLITEISRRSRLKVIHTTGVHKEAHYPQDHPIRNFSVEQLRKLFTFEIQNGFISDDLNLTSLQSNSPDVKAGLIKFGVGSEEISQFESRALEAAAVVTNELGVAIMVHTEGGHLVHEVLDQLESNNCDLSRVAIAHLDRKPELSLHKEVVERGAFIGHDGAGRRKYWPDETLIKLFSDLAENGYSAKILLGADVARSSRYVEYGGGPGLAYLGERFIPKLRAATSDEIVMEVLTKNPQNWLAFTP
jgi:phosphotriesterase-related protein